MYLKKGSEIPATTNVYITNTIYTQDCTQIYVQKVRASDYSILTFVFYSSDGLWASINARDFWAKYPDRHPYCTLFGLLYKKLQIRELVSSRYNVI